MRTFIHSALLVVLIAVGVTTGCSPAKEKNPEADQRAADAEKAAGDAKAEAAARKEMAEHLQAKLDEVVKTLVTTSDRLATVSAENQRLKAANVKRLEDAKNSSKVPLPVVSNGDFTFPKLVNSKLEVVGENLEFSTRFGRTLIFRAPDGKRPKYDIDQLHSVVLSLLGIDPESAKADQMRIDGVDKAIADRAAKAAAANAAPKEGVTPEKSEDPQRERTLDTDRADAEAAMKRASAAVVAAQKP